MRETGIRAHLHQATANRGRRVYRLIKLSMGYNLIRDFAVTVTIRTLAPLEVLIDSEEQVRVRFAIPSEKSDLGSGNSAREENVSDPCVERDLFPSDNG
jgi:hypothetical protein